MASTKTTQRGLQDGWTRATFILRKHHLEELKALAIRGAILVSFVIIVDLIYWLWL
jgi:hypothetical protein